MTGDAETLTETERLMLRNRMLAGGASEFVDPALASLLSHHIAPTVAAILAAHDERVRAAAWAEGHNAGMDDVWNIEREGQSGYTANPYLAAPTSEPTP